MKLNKSIRLKNFFCLLTVSVLPVLFFSLYTQDRNLKSYNQQIEDISSAEVQRITERINKNYEDVQDIISSLIFSTYDGRNCIDTIFEREREETAVSYSDRLYNYRMFKYICNNLLENAKHVEGVYLFCENGHTYSYMVNKDYGIEKTYQEDTWYQTLQSGSTVDVIEMVKLNKPVYGQGDSCLLAARKYLTMKNQSQGVLAVVCSNSIFDEISSQEEELPWGSSRIITKEGELVYGALGAEVMTRQELKEISDNEKGIILTDNIRQAFIYGSLDINNWKVVSVLSFEASYDVYLQNNRMMFVLIIFDILLIIVMVFWMDRNYIRPVVCLARGMDSAAQSGFVAGNAYKDREDEVGILYAYYEKMLYQINQLIEEKYESEIKILKSRLRNLTSQINSHFIFNTLENISCLAQIENQKQISVMSKSLGDMLHFSMDFEGDFIRLEKEIAHTRHYLDIQEIRFGSEIKLSLKLSGVAGERKVMRFMLQPIVENAIEHGLVGKETPWVITLTAKQQEENMILSVEDNGVGVSEEMLEKIRQRIYEPENVERERRCYNIGLSNIHQRIQLLFSDKCGLYIDSSPKRGTIVTIKIPWM